MVSPHFTINESLDKERVEWTGGTEKINGLVGQRSTYKTLVQAPGEDA